MSRCRPLKQERSRHPGLCVSASTVPASETDLGALWRAAQALPHEPPVCLAQTPRGRGLIVSRSGGLAPGDTVVSVPLDLCLSVDYDAPGADAVLGQLLLDACKQHGFWRLYREAVLPQDTGAAVLWQPELIEQLQWQPAVEEALAARLQFKSLAARMVGGDSMEDRLWALSIVHSRSFAVQTEHGRLRVLAPIADLVNNEQVPSADVASSEAESPWGLHEGRFVLFATAPFSEGNELTMFYGHETSASLLISYGFAPESNACDFLDMYSDLHELCDDDRWMRDRDRAGLATKKRQMLWSADAAAAPLAVRPGGLRASAHLLGCLRVLHCTATLLQALEESYDEAVGHFVWTWKQGAGGEQQRVDALALHHACERAKELLHEMGSAIEADEAELAELRGQPELLAAIRFRISVKQMLTQFIDEASDAAGIVNRL